MAYRNGTYIAFHAEGKTDPTASDIKYYRLLKSWHENDNVDFRFVNSHDKVAACRDTSTDATIKRSLRERLQSSKNMVLILGPKTKLDDDFVPYEITYAIDTCKIPIIVAYTGYSSILNVKAHRNEWPKALLDRIDNGTAKAIHIPFNRNAIDAAIKQFTLTAPPPNGISFWAKSAQMGFGIKFGG